MKFPLRLPIPLLALAVLMPCAGLQAQTADDSSADTPPPPGSTVITSDELHSDQNTHVSVFTGRVVTTGTNFKMTCQEMTVYFTNDNKVQKIVATGDVIITQPDRVTHCGRAEYTRDTDTFVLTDQPVILDHKNEIHGVQITIERATQKMTVEGGRSTVIINNDSMGATSSPQPSTDNNK